MKNIMKGLKKNSGFTLIEMIVVIGIIGVLAGILIPTFRGYVLSANKANDKVMARSLYDKTKITIIQDWDAWNSFYSYNSSRMRVNEDGYNPADAWSDRNYTPYSDGIYEIVFNHKLDGSVPLKDDGGYKVISGSMETKYFAGMMNKQLGLSTVSNKRVKAGYTNRLLKTYYEFDEEDTALGKHYKTNKKKEWLYPMKYTSFESQYINNTSGNIVNRWLIAYRYRSPNVIEIWAGNSGGAGASGPRYRVYPNPFEEYNRT